MSKNITSKENKQDVSLMLIKVLKKKKNLRYIFMTETHQFVKKFEKRGSKKI